MAIEQSIPAADDRYRSRRQDVFLGLMNMINQLKAKVLGSANVSSQNLTAEGCLMRKSYLFTAICLFAASLFVVQGADVYASTTGEIQGVVRDAQTGETLPGANVVLGGTKRGATTARVPGSTSSATRTTGTSSTTRHLVVRRPPGRTVRGIPGATTAPARTRTNTAEPSRG